MDTDQKEPLQGQERERFQNQQEQNLKTYSRFRELVSGVSQMLVEALVFTTSAALSHIHVPSATYTRYPGAFSDAGPSPAWKGWTLISLNSYWFLPFCY